MWSEFFSSRILLKITWWAEKRVFSVGLWFLCMVLSGLLRKQKKIAILSPFLFRGGVGGCKRTFLSCIVTKAQKENRRGEMGSSCASENFLFLFLLMWQGNGITKKKYEEGFNRYAFLVLKQKVKENFLVDEVKLLCNYTRIIVHWMLFTFS